MTRFDLFDPLADARKVVDDFNARHGGAYLKVSPNAGRAVVFSAAALDHVRMTLTGKYTARALFEYVFERPATHGELINLGRQLVKVFPVHKLGPHSIYTIGADVPNSR